MILNKILCEWCQKESIFFFIGKFFQFSFLFLFNFVSFNLNLIKVLKVMGRSLRELMKLSFSNCHFKWWIRLSFKVNWRRIGKLVERDEKINQSSYLNNAGASILHPPAWLQLGKCNQFPSKALPLALPVVELESMINLNFQQFKYWFKLCHPPSCKLFPSSDWIYILPSFTRS